MTKDLSPGIKATKTKSEMLAASLAVGLIEAWLIMLALGIAHRQWSVIPAFGYLATYVLFSAFRFLRH